MDDRMKGLIAVGASITANCQPCLTHHVRKAKEHGANEEEIKEAIAVARMVRKGAMGKMDQFASTMFKDTPAVKDAGEEGRGCG